MKKSNALILLITPCILLSTSLCITAMNTKLIQNKETHAPKKSWFLKKWLRKLTSSKRKTAKAKQLISPNPPPPAHKKKEKEIPQRAAVKPEPTFATVLLAQRINHKKTDVVPCLFILSTRIT